MKLSSTLTIAFLSVFVPSLAFPISLNKVAVAELANVKRAVTSFGETLFEKRSPGLDSSLSSLSSGGVVGHNLDSNWAHEPDNQLITKRSPGLSVSSALSGLSSGGVATHNLDPNWAHEPDNQLFVKRSSAESTEQAQ